MYYCTNQPISSVTSSRHLLCHLQVWRCTISSNSHSLKPTKVKLLDSINSYAAESIMREWTITRIVGTNDIKIWCKISPQSLQKVRRLMLSVNRAKHLVDIIHWHQLVMGHTCSMSYELLIPTGPELTSFHLPVKQYQCTYCHIPSGLYIYLDFILWSMNLLQWARWLGIVNL